MINSPGSAPSAVPEEGTAALAASGNSRTETQSPRSLQWAQTLVLVVLFSMPAILCLRLAYVADPDVWWHLRSGEMTLMRHTVPHTDLFSSIEEGKPWTALSWLYEVLILQFFQRLGLVGIVTYTTGMVVLITVVLHRLIRHLQADFSFAVLLTAVASYCISSTYTPRPWLFSILFFALELDFLMQARKTGKIRELVWLPIVFVLWTNLHVEFFIGLLVLAIAFAETVLGQRWPAIQTRLRPRSMGGIFIACVLATLLTPYGASSYKALYGLAAQSSYLSKVSEIQAIPFRRLDEWGVLFLALAATGVLARARRFALFESGLLAFGVYTSFRSQRDLWVVVISASAILAAGLKGDETNRLRLTKFAAPFIALGTVVAVWLGFRVLHVDNARLRADLAAEMPVRAVEVVKEKGWSGPLFNDFNWGGYLIWDLRMPVSAYGGQGFIGDERVDRFLATWNGQPGWASDPDLAQAALVIAPLKMPLTQLLRMDPRFQLAYEDKLTAVFVARKSMSSNGAISPAVGSMAAHAAVK